MRLFITASRIQEICDAAGVKLVYLALSPPRLNPIQGFFAELKAFFGFSYIDSKCILLFSVTSQACWKSAFAKGSRTFDCCQPMSALDWPDYLPGWKFAFTVFFLSL